MTNRLWCTHYVSKETDFENDSEMLKHLDIFCDIFRKIIKSETGTFVLQSIEGAVKSIKDKHSFVSAVKLTSEVVHTLNIDSTDKFGLFLGCIGIIIAFASHPGPDTTVSKELQKIISQTYQLILYTALVPFWSGTRNSIGEYTIKDWVYKNYSEGNSDVIIVNMILMFSAFSGHPKL